MTADPKNPNNDPGQAEGSDERYEAVETTLAVASDDPVDVELTGEALKEDGDAENAPGTTREQASGSGSRALTLFLVVVLSLAAAAVGAALGPRILPQESDSGLASLQTPTICVAVRSGVPQKRIRPGRGVDGTHGHPGNQTWFAG